MPHMPEEQKPKDKQAKASGLERMAAASTRLVGLVLLSGGAGGFAYEIYDVLNTPPYVAKSWADYFQYALPKVALTQLSIYLSYFVPIGLGGWLMSSNAHHSAEGGK